MSDELASAYLPDGVEVDDTTRHVAAQLALAWMQLTPAQRRLVIEYERCLEPHEAARRAELSTANVESYLAADRVRLVLRLRSTLQTDTIPPQMIGRVLTRIALGIDEANAHQRIRAAVELARVQGAYVPPSHLLPKNPEETGAEALDQDAQDRIVAAAASPGGGSFADWIRTRVADAQAEEARAAAAEAHQAELTDLARQATETDAKSRTKRRRVARGSGSGIAVDPVVGTVPEGLANTDALAIARAKMGRPR